MVVETRAARRQSMGTTPEKQQPSAFKDEFFRKGVAISMWQNSGDEDSNWTHFIKSFLPFKWLPFGIKRYSGKYSVLQTCPDTWNR